MSSANFLAGAFGSLALLIGFPDVPAIGAVAPGGS